MKDLRNILKNKKGFTLVEVMISALILAIVGAGIMAAMQTQNDASRAKRKSNYTDKLHHRIAKGLESRETCRSSAQGLGGSLTKDITSLDGFPIDNSDLGGEYQGVSIESANLNMDPLMVPETNNLIHTGVLAITYNRNPNSTKKVIGGDKIIRKVNIQAKKVGDKIVECSSGFLEDENKRISCENSGGDWTVAANNVDDGFCEVNEQLPTVGTVLSNCNIISESNNAVIDEACIADIAMCEGLGGNWNTTTSECDM